MSRRRASMKTHRFTTARCSALPFWTSLQPMTQRSCQGQLLPKNWSRISWRCSSTLPGRSASTTTSCSATPSLRLERMRQCSGSRPRVFARRGGRRPRDCALHRRELALVRSRPPCRARLIVAESALNVACAGARPVALVNCLNFGNPEHPAVMWQLSEAIDGMAEACKALGIPVVGGNVSLYNESMGTDIDPTPVVGTLGLIDKLEAGIPTPSLREGSRVLLLGRTARALPPLRGRAGRPNGGATPAVLSHRST